MSTVFPRIIERTHLKLILRSPASASFIIFITLISCLVFWFMGYMMSDISFKCHREESRQVNCLIQDSRLFNLIQLEPEYFNSIKEAKLGSKQVTTNSDEGDSSIDTEYYVRLVNNDNKISDSVFRSANFNRYKLGLIKHQINSFINSQRSSLVVTEKIERMPNKIEDFLFYIFIFCSLLMLKKLYTRSVSDYFVFDKYSQKLEHTVKIFNWSLKSQCYKLSDIKKVSLTKAIGKSSGYTLSLLLNLSEESHSQKDILLSNSYRSIGNLLEILKVVSDFLSLSVKSTNEGMES